MMNNHLDWFRQKHWTQNASARDANGNSISPVDMAAEKWDLMSAIIISYRRDRVDEAYQHIERIKKSCRILFPNVWNQAKEANQREPTLPMLNDFFEDFSQVRKVLNFS
jgi:hypothetical protein